MNTSKKLLGSICFIVSGAWLLAVHAHPLVLLFLRATRRHASHADPLRSFPFPPNYFDRFSWDAWWPFIVGMLGVLIGAVLIAAPGVCRESADRIEIHRKENREF
jgi:hypothetical protein